MKKREGWRQRWGRRGQRGRKETEREGWRGWEDGGRETEREGWRERDGGDGRRRLRQERERTAGFVLKTREHTATSLLCPPSHAAQKASVFFPCLLSHLSRVHRFLSKCKLGMKEESAGTADQGCFPAPCHGRAIRSDFSQYFHIPLPFFSVIPSTSVSETLARWVAS